MGQTLGTAAQWTSASADGVGKLELTAANEVILNKIIAFIDGFPLQHSAESKVTFKQPLIWTTELSSANFTAGYSHKYVHMHCLWLSASSFFLIIFISQMVCGLFLSWMAVFGVGAWGHRPRPPVLGHPLTSIFWGDMNCSFLKVKTKPKMIFTLLQLTLKFVH